MGERLIFFKHEIHHGTWALTGTVHDVESQAQIDLNATTSHRIVGRVHTFRTSDDAKRFARQKGEIAFMRVVDEPEPDAMILSEERALIPLPREVATAIVSDLGGVALQQR